MGAMKVPMLVGMMETRASVMEASMPEFLTTPVNAPAAKTMETIRNAACAWLLMILCCRSTLG